MSFLDLPRLPLWNIRRCLDSVRCPVVSLRALEKVPIAVQLLGVQTAERLAAAITDEERPEDDVQAESSSMQRRTR